jgi:hypothetical protein
MASGKTLDLRLFERSIDYWPVKPWVQKERDRSLRGKARRLARKAARRA